MTLHDSLLMSEVLPKQIAGMREVPDQWDIGQDHAAVVCMIFIPDPDFPDSRPARVLLTKRSHSVGTHKGQISFPGGHRDPEDSVPVSTGLRELEEEVGIPRAAVKVHGSLSPSRSLTNAHVITLICSALVKPQDIQASPDEVEEILLPPWTVLTQALSQPFDLNIFGLKRTSELFLFEGHRIWGLTAGMIWKADLR